MTRKGGDVMTGRGITKVWSSSREYAFREVRLVILAKFSKTTVVPKILVLVEGGIVGCAQEGLNSAKTQSRR